MEQFKLALPSVPVTRLPVTSVPAAATAPASCALRGVVASGDLEVLVEAGAPTTECHFEIHTGADGFRDTWQAVLEDFARSQAAGGLCFTVNDVGSTPAVVTLRLGQALEAWLQQARSAP